MARRPAPPRAHPGTAARPQQPAPQRSSRDRAQNAQHAQKEQKDQGAADSSAPRAARPERERPARTASGRTASGRAASTQEHDGSREGASREGRGARGRIVPAADRFGSMLRARPWRRRRRAIVLWSAGVVAALVVLFVVAVTIPPLKVHEVSVDGTSYVDQKAVGSAAQPQLGSSMLLARTGTVEDEVEGVPGVQEAEVSKHWPSTLSIHVTERTPLASLKDADGSTQILDSEGVRLPEKAGEDADLVPLTISGSGADTTSVSRAMLSVLSALPEDMRSSVTAVKASSPDDVTLSVDVDGTEKTIVWGNAEDSDLKAEVSKTLLGQPGSEIDVTSPVAPVTR
jgi:cell division protein FtsQ